MVSERTPSDGLNEFMAYLAAHPENGDNRLPALAELSRALGISVASLREQFEVARALGLVEARPRTGIRRLPYSFQPAVRRSLAYAMATDESAFEAFSNLRNHIESAYWFEAVSRLTEEDLRALRCLVDRALEKLAGWPVHIPHQEHRELHLLIFSRLNNPFVTGILEAYWSAYEAVGLAYFTDLPYLKKVWAYHEKIVHYLCEGNAEAGYQALMEHANLLNLRTQPVSRARFE